MRYKTTIEIITEARSEAEAIDIAGEFLRSELESGVSMTCRTKPYRKTNQAVKSGIGLFLVLVCISTLSAGYITKKPVASLRRKEISAFQPPLRTKGDSQFEEAWKAKEEKALFEFVKKN